MAASISASWALAASGPSTTTGPSAPIRSRQSAGHQREIPGGGDGALAVGELRLGHRPAVRAAGERPRAGLDRREEHDAVRQHRLDVGGGDGGVAARP